MPSRFLNDMGFDVARNVQPTFSQRDEYDEFSDGPGLDIGDRVKSSQFGAGEVIDIDGMAVTVAFDAGQTKKLNVEYARLEKL